MYELLCTNIVKRNGIEERKVLLNEFEHMTRITVSRKN